MPYTHYWGHKIPTEAEPPSAQDKARYREQEAQEVACPLPEGAENLPPGSLRRTCSNDHPLGGDPENVYWYPDGKWACRGCRREASHRKRARRRAQKQQLRAGTP